MTPSRPVPHADQQPAHVVSSPAAQPTQPSSATIIAAIRQALSAMPSTPFKRPFPLTVAVDGAPALHLMARIDALARNGSQGVVHLTTLKRGRLLRGSPEAWIANQFVLNGKDELKPSSVLPRAVSAEEAAQFHANFQAPPGLSPIQPTADEHETDQAPRP